MFWFRFFNREKHDSINFHDDDDDDNICGTLNLIEKMWRKILAFAFEKICISKKKFSNNHYDDDDDDGWEKNRCLCP